MQPLKRDRVKLTISKKKIYSLKHFPFNPLLERYTHINTLPLRK